MCIHGSGNACWQINGKQMVVFDGAGQRRPTLVVLSQDNDGPDELRARG